jgi:hypothetical protein
MPEDIGGGFDGGGSVRWEVVTSDDDPAKYATQEQHGETKKGRKTNGRDKHDGKQFKIILKVPTDSSRAAEFLQQFANPVPNDAGEIVLFLDRDKNEKNAKQVRVLWEWKEPSSQVSQSS